MAIPPYMSQKLLKYYEEKGETANAELQRRSIETVSKAREASHPVAIIKLKEKNNHHEIRFFCFQTDTLEARIAAIDERCRKTWVANISENNIFLGKQTVPFSSLPLSEKRNLIKDLKNRTIKLNVSFDQDDIEKIESLTIEPPSSISKKLLAILILSIFAAGIYLIIFKNKN